MSITPKTTETTSDSEPEATVLKSEDTCSLAESGNATPTMEIEAKFMKMSEFLKLHKFGNETPDTQYEAIAIQAASKYSFATPAPQSHGTISENTFLTTSRSMKTTSNVHSQAAVLKSSDTPETIGTSATTIPEKDVKLHPALGTKLCNTQNAKPSVSLLNELQQFGVVKIRYDSLGFYSAEDGEEAAWVEIVAIESTGFKSEHMGHGSTKRKAKEMAATKAFREGPQLRDLLRSLPIKYVM